MVERLAACNQATLRPVLLLISCSILPPPDSQAGWFASALSAVAAGEGPGSFRLLAARYGGRCCCLGVTASAAGCTPVPTQQPAGVWVPTVKCRGEGELPQLGYCPYMQTHTGWAAGPKKSRKSDFAEPLHCLDWTTFNGTLEVGRQTVIGKYVDLTVAKYTSAVQSESNF